MVSLFMISKAKHKPISLNYQRDWLGNRQVYVQHTHTCTISNLKKIPIQSALPKVKRSIGHFGHGWCKEISVAFDNIKLQRMCL
jgi:hypothetical protein